jgi:hypothetical protein
MWLWNDPSHLIMKKSSKFFKLTITRKINAWGRIQTFYRYICFKRDLFFLAYSQSIVYY